MDSDEKFDEGEVNADDGRYFTAVISPVFVDADSADTAGDKPAGDALSADVTGHDDDLPAGDDDPDDGLSVDGDDPDDRASDAAPQDLPTDAAFPFEDGDNTPEAIRMQAAAEKAALEKDLQDAQEEQREALANLGAAVFADMETDASLAMRYDGLRDAVRSCERRTDDIEKRLGHTERKATMKIEGLVAARAAVEASKTAEDEYAAKERAAAEAAQKAAALAAEVEAARNAKIDAEQQARDAAAAAAKTQLLTVITPQKVEEMVQEAHQLHVSGSALESQSASSGISQGAPTPAPAVAPHAVSQEVSVTPQGVPATASQGVPAMPVAASGERVCPNCGATVSGDDLFCFSCGGRLEAPASVPAPEPAPAGSFCPTCGMPSVPGDLFCMHCGSRLA